MASSRPHSIPGWYFGCVSILTLFINAGIVAYMAYQNDPATVHLMWPFKTHPYLAFGGLSFGGTLAGILGARKTSPAWFVPAAANLIFFLLELSVS